jgi:hypothetical protein
MDTPVHAYSIQDESQFAERRGCSSATGVRTLSACGEQGEKAAAARHIIPHDNSRRFWSWNPEDRVPLKLEQLVRARLCFLFRARYVRQWTV